MSFLFDTSKLLTALSRVPVGGANQQAVKQTVDELDKNISEIFSIATDGAGTYWIYLLNTPDQAGARFILHFTPTSVSFGIDLKSPSSSLWVNKVTYTQT